MTGAVNALLRSLHLRGILATRSLPLPVVSVGNLSVGGTGKTPHVAHLARFFQDRGLRPCILSRGYGREGRGVVAVSDGERVLVPPRTGGDEPVLLARLLPGVPVVVGESRYGAGESFLEGGGHADLFLLDDGFQHHSLRRDADVVLVDCRAGLGNGLTLPLGPLREGRGALRNAHAVVVTKCPTLPEGERRALSLALPRGMPWACTSLAPTRLVGPDGEGHPLPGPGWELCAFSALAGNGQFRGTLEGLGWRVARFRGFRDHHRFTGEELDRLRREAGGLPLVTTRKDLVRIPPGRDGGILALDVEVLPLRGMDVVERLLLERVEERRSARP